MTDQPALKPPKHRVWKAADAHLAVGTEVLVRRDNGEIWQTRTRSDPWEAGGRLVVQVNDISGCYELSRVYVLAKVSQVKEPACA